MLDDLHMPEDAHAFLSRVPSDRLQEGYAFRNVFDPIALYSFPVEYNITSKGAQVHEHVGRAVPVMQLHSLLVCARLL